MYKLSLTEKEWIRLCGRVPDVRIIHVNGESMNEPLFGVIEEDANV